MLATAIREAMNLVDMEVPESQEGEVHLGLEEETSEVLDVTVLPKLRETIRKLQESQAKADEAQEFLDVMTMRHATEGCVECQKRSHCQASGCKGSVCTCREECKDRASCPTVCVSCHGIDNGFQNGGGENMCMAQFVSAGYNYHG